MGILNTNGEYLINVDPDDLLYENNDLEYLYNTANKLKVDIINFGYLNGHEFNLKCSNFKKILRQPQLFEHAFTYDNRFNDLAEIFELKDRIIYINSTIPPISILNQPFHINDTKLMLLKKESINYLKKNLQY